MSKETNFKKVPCWLGFMQPVLPFLCCCRCYLLDGISKGAWLNRSSIIFAGNDKWSVDPRVSIVSGIGDKHEYSLQITKVDVTDDGLYTCSIQSERSPRPKLLNLIVKGECLSWYARHLQRVRPLHQKAQPMHSLQPFCANSQQRLISHQIERYFSDEKRIQK